jgi:hypothetical protein
MLWVMSGCHFFAVQSFCQGAKENEHRGFGKKIVRQKDTRALGMGEGKVWNI